MKSFLSITFFIFVIFISSYDQIFSQPLTSRPSVVEPAKTIDKNQFRFETGFLYNYYEYDDFSDYYVTVSTDPFNMYQIGPIQLSYGLFDVTELRVGGSINIYHDAYYHAKIENPMVQTQHITIILENGIFLFASLKQQLFSNDEFRLAALLNFTNYQSSFSRDIEDVYNDKFVHENETIHENLLNMIISADVYLDRFTISVNQGVLATLKAEDYNAITSAAVFYSINNNLEIFTDFLYWYNIKALFEGQETISSFLNNLGVQYELTENIAVDASAGYLLSSDYYRLFAGAGLVLTF